MEEKHERRFTGFFIPVEVLNDPRLGATDKLLLAEIDALRGEEGEGCYASNAYLGKVVGVSEARAKDIITKLRRLNYVETVKTDGRRRWLIVTRKLADRLFSSYQTAPEQATRPLESKPIDTSRAEKKERKVSCDFADANLQQEWEAWQQHRIEMRKPLTVIARGRQVRALSIMGVPRAIAAIRHSIEKGWTGIFEPPPVKSRAAALPYKTRENKINQLNARKADLLRMEQTPKVKMELEQIRIQLFDL